LLVSFLEIGGNRSAQFRRFDDDIVVDNHPPTDAKQKAPFLRNFLPPASAQRKSLSIPISRNAKKEKKPRHTQKKADLTQAKAETKHKPIYFSHTRPLRLLSAHTKYK